MESANIKASCPCWFPINIAVLIGVIPRKGIEIESIISDWAKFTVDGSGASAGTITANYSQIDNQDIY